MENHSLKYTIKYGGTFAQKIAPSIISFYQQQKISKTNRDILDICCGTGQLALEFLKENYYVLGIDLSPHMLFYARKNNREYIQKGLVEFKEADASNFSLETKFGLAIASYDAINHLEGALLLKDCFQCVYNSVVIKGYFIFDLNTRLGLERWNSININESKKFLLIIKGVFDRENNRAITRVSGFIKEEDSNLYSHFEEVVYNYAYDMSEIRKLLKSTGWRNIYFANILDLNNKIKNPEAEERVLAIA